MTEEQAWKAFLELVKEDPFLWALYPEPDGIVTIEYFGEGYTGDLEKGTGDWEVSGTLVQAVETAQAKINMPGNA